jgi:pimeloyl-ACP methyl ester carboxylesterase
VRKTQDYTLDGHADQITAPTLVMGGESDQFLKGEPQKVHKALTSADATLVTLTGAEGAGEHTHAGALGRAHQVMFDWLDTTLTA